jgi:hypothetical protein
MRFRIKTAKLRNITQGNQLSRGFLNGGAANGQLLVALPEVALGSTILLLLVPQVPEEFCRGWPVPRVMVVAEGQNFQDFGVAHQ